MIKKVRTVEQVLADMKKATVVKHIKYAPMTLHEYYSFKGLECEGDETEGYIVMYETSDDNEPNVKGMSGYVSWSPKEPLEKAISDYEPIAKKLSSLDSKYLDIEPYISDGNKVIIVQANDVIIGTVLRTGKSPNTKKKKIRIATVKNGMLTVRIKDIKEYSIGYKGVDGKEYVNDGLRFTLYGLKFTFKMN